jgi:large subunit ribosomal protein L3
MANGMKGLLGRKMGMTQIFSEDGLSHGVTVVDLDSNVVLRVKTDDDKDGYNAVQIGFGPKRQQRTNKPDAANFAKAGATPKKHVREFRLDKNDLTDLAPGQKLQVADYFNAGDRIDVSGTSKGRGFTGVMVRYNFAGFIRSHGTHEFFRHGGSIGTRLTPGHVLKGKKMTGHSGAERVTVQSLEVVKVDAERNLLFIRGGLPGPNGGLLEIRQAIKV